MTNLEVLINPLKELNQIVDRLGLLHSDLPKNEYMVLVMRESKGHISPEVVSDFYDKMREGKQL